MAKHMAHVMAKNSKKSDWPKKKILAQTLKEQ